MEQPIAKRAYYSIGEVCELAGLKPHVLRYWETQFEVIRPTKNRAGNRVYRPKEVESVLLVKHLLYDQKYTIEGAVQRIREMRKAGEMPEKSSAALEDEFLSEMKEDLHRLIAVLTPGTVEAEGT
jgi:DNA-binding transcriptional MerR regulator